MIHDLLERLNQRSLQAERPTSDNGTGWESDDVVDFPMGDVPNGTYTAHKLIDLPDFAQGYLRELEAENSPHLTDMRAAMSMFMHCDQCLVAQENMIFTCAITTLQNEYEYYLSWNGCELLVHLSSDAPWGIRGREVIAQWCDRFREKASVSVILTEEAA